MGEFKQESIVSTTTGKGQGFGRLSAVLALGCAIVATVLPTFLINAGLARVSSQAVSMIATVSPVVTIGLAITILGEPFTAADALGSFLVLLGVGLFTWGDSRTKMAPVKEVTAEAAPLPAKTP